MKANKTSKLQTELGTYHLQYDEQNPVRPIWKSISVYGPLGPSVSPNPSKVPTDMPTWPSRDELLQHFAKAVLRFGQAFCGGST